MDEQRECIQRPIEDIGETLYVILCDFHGLAVYVYVYGNDNDEWKTEEKR